MKIAKCKLKSVSPYSQGKYHKTEKLSKELHADYEERAWREKMHCGEDNIVFIPPMAFANCIKEAATYLSIPIPGQGKSKYTKNFQSGVMVTEPLMLDINKDDVVRIVEAEESSNSKYQLGENYCFIPEVLYAGHLAASGKIGPTVYSESEYLHDVTYRWREGSFGDEEVPSGSGKRSGGMDGYSNRLRRSDRRSSEGKR